MFVSWFTGGTKEPEPENTVVLSQSDDGGKTFSVPQAMGLPLNDGTRCYDPCLWIDPKGGSGYLFNRSVRTASSTRGLCASVTIPMLRRRFGARSSCPARSLQFPDEQADGALEQWALPVVHALEPLAAWAGFDPKQVFGAAISTDEGKTWNLHGAVKTEKAGLENMIVELKDGRLWMLIRTEKVLWESHSSDKAAWTGRPPSPRRIHTSSSAACPRAICFW